MFITQNKPRIPEPPCLLDGSLEESSNGHSPTHDEAYSTRDPERTTSLTACHWVLKVALPSDEVRQKK